jgi:hypothetical protein
VPVIVASVLIDALVDAFGQHHDGEVDRRGGDLGDDRRVDDTQPGDPLDGPHRVGDGLRVSPGREVWRRSVT